MCPRLARCRRRPPGEYSPSANGYVHRSPEGMRGRLGSGPVPGRLALKIHVELFDVVGLQLGRSHPFLHLGHRHDGLAIQHHSDGRNVSFARSQRSVTADCFIAFTGPSALGYPVSIGQPPIVSVDSPVVAGQILKVAIVRFGAVRTTTDCAYASQRCGVRPKLEANRPCTIRSERYPRRQGRRIPCPTPPAQRRGGTSRRFSRPSVSPDRRSRPSRLWRPARTEAWRARKLRRQRVTSVSSGRRPRGAWCSISLLSWSLIPAVTRIGLGLRTETRRPSTWCCCPWHCDRIRRSSSWHR